MLKFIIDNEDNIRRGASAAPQAALRPTVAVRADLALFAAELDRAGASLPKDRTRAHLS